MKKSVCIIGAGAAGLCSLQNILASNAKGDGIILEPTVFEKSDTIGGVWDYRDNEEENLGNPMYSGLRVNLPKETMRFLDFGPENYDSESSYVTQPIVLKYLNRYADAYNLRDHIQLNRKVTNIKKIEEKDLKWLVTVKNTNDDEQTWEYEFDSVIVCNGHHNKCKYPENYEQIQKAFKGTLLHSRDYNKPENYKEKSIVVVGGGASGLDISLETSKYAKNVYLSLKDPENQSFSNLGNLQNFHQVPRIQTAKESSVILVNGEEIECDTIILCTGYDYEFLFLQEGIPEIREDGRQVSPLYLHMIHMKYPSLCFIGIPYLALPFILFDCQAGFYVKYLRGDLTLPTEAEMLEEFNKEQCKRKCQGLSGHQSHLFHSLQWPYFDKLATQAGVFDKLVKFSPTLKKVYQIVLQGIFKNPLFYRDRTFEDMLQDSETIEHEGDAYNLNLKC